MNESHGLTRRGVLGVALGGTAAAALPALPAWGADEQRPGAGRPPTLSPWDRLLVRQLSSRRALDDLRVLSERIGPRIGGTASERRAADYLAHQLEREGYDVALQPFAVADKFLAEIGDPKRLLPDDICWQAGSSPGAALNVTVQGLATDVGPATAPVWPADVTGRVLLADDNVGARATFAAEAVARGAVAVILLRPDLEFPRRAQAFSPSGLDGVPIPVIGVAQVQKQRLREALTVVPALPLTISTSAHTGLTSHNVVAEKRARPGSPVVMVSGHYDSVIGAPGANDDGSGTVLTASWAGCSGDCRAPGRRTGSVCGVRRSRG